MLLCMLKVPPAPLAAKPPTYREAVQTRMRVLVSLLVLGTALFMLLSGADPEAEKWCYSVVAAIVTYWLKQ